MNHYELSVLNVKAGSYTVHTSEVSSCAPTQTEAQEAARVLIRYAGGDLTNPGMVDTPRRLVALLDELTSVREEEVTTTVFPSVVDDLVVVRDIAFASLCQHHALTYAGSVAIGYLPSGQVLGLSKFARLVRKHAAGFTIQEGLTHTLATAISEATGSPDVAVITEALHSCMAARGVRAFGATTFASVMFGRFRESDALRAEFLNLVKSK